MIIKKETITYEVTLSKCPHCGCKLHMISMSKDLKDNIERILLMYKIHKKKCYSHYGSKKIGKIKILTTVDKQNITTMTNIDNLIIL